MSSIFSTNNWERILVKARCGGGYSRLIGECVHRYGGITPISWEGKGNGEGY